MNRHRLVPLLIAIAAITAATAPVSGQTLSTYVEAEDGILLATDVYLPFGSGPWPVILIRTPYDKSTLFELGIAFSILNYAVVIQDTRGRFESEGVNTVFRDDAADGRVTVEWVTTQTWCDGHIGGFGGSAFAITQYLLAPGSGTNLTSMLAVVATPDVYHHAFLQGGAVRESLAYNWLADQDALYMYDEVLNNRLMSEWWDPAEVIAYSDQLAAAGLHVGGWYDIFGQGSVDAFAEFQDRGGPGARGRQYLMMGPWSHGSLGTREVGELRYPFNAAVDPLGMILPWLDHTLKGHDNDVDDWRPVRVYLMGAVGEEDAPGNVWVEFDSWPPHTVATGLFLTEDSGLVDEPPIAGEIRLDMDPTDPVPTLGGANLFPNLEVDGRAMGDGPYDQQPIESRDDVFTFTSDELMEPMSVMGRVSCVLWVRPDTTDFDLAVRLTDVYPDGRSMLVLDGIQRFRMSCGDDVECFAVPGEPVEVTVDLWSTALVFNAGHRVRVSISGSNAPRFEVNPNHGGDLNGDDPPSVAQPDLLFGPEYPSRLVVPVRPPMRRATGRVAPDVEPRGRSIMPTELLWDVLAGRQPHE
jgi:predicted acyl esterase